MPEGALQAALPREMYVDQEYLARRDGRPCCSVSGSASAGSTTSASTTRRVCVVVDVVGSRSSSPATSRRVLHGAYNVCRHRGSQVLPVVEDERAAGGLRGIGTALSLPLVDLPPRRSAAARAAHRSRESRPPRTSALHPVGGRDLGRLRLRAPHARARRRRSSTQWRARTPTLAQLRPRRAGHRRDPDATRSRPTTRCCSRTTTSATTAVRSTPSCAGWCRRSPAAVATSTGRAAYRTATAPGRSPRPAPRTRAPLPGLTEARAHPSQGRRWSTRT